MRASITLPMLIALAAAGCHDGGRTAASNPIVTLLDVNPESPTYGQQVGRDTHAGHVSAWYFGSST